MRRPLTSVVRNHAAVLLACDFCWRTPIVNGYSEVYAASAWTNLSLGPGIPDPPAGLPTPPLIGHRLPSDSRVVTRAILSGLHHEYGLEKVAA